MTKYNSYKFLTEPGWQRPPKAFGQPMLLAKVWVDWNHYPGPPYLNPRIRWQDERTNRKTRYRSDTVRNYCTLSSSVVARSLLSRHVPVTNVPLLGCFVSIRMQSMLDWEINLCRARLLRLRIGMSLRCNEWVGFQLGAFRSFAASYITYYMWGWCGQGMWREECLVTKRVGNI